MKQLISIALLSIALTSGALAEATPPHIDVLGTAVAEAKPDLLRWSIAVSNKGPDASLVSTTHTQRAAAVLRFLRDRGIRNEEIQSSEMQLVQNREYRGSSWLVEGYIATTRFSFKMRSLAEYREVWLGLARLDGMEITAVQWDVSNRIDLQNSARTEALKQARAKAVQMAQALNATVRTPLAIEEVPIENPWAGAMAQSNSVQPVAAAEESSELLSPGSVSIRSRVRVSFALGAP